MGTEFKDLDTTPTLTLDPFQAADKKETPAVQQVEEPVLDDSVLTEEERQRGLITASAGNHAQGVAYAAKRRWRISPNRRWIM